MIKKRIPNIPFGAPCPQCGCTDRTMYEGTKRLFFGKQGDNKKFYTTRYTRCRRCGQKRMEFRVEIPK